MAFYLDLLTLETGDSVWWKWTNTQALITVKLSDHNLISTKNVDFEICRNFKGKLIEAKEPYQQTKITKTENIFLKLGY